jgi:outer membrane receptor protein involved in Fe transport
MRPYVFAGAALASCWAGCGWAQDATPAPPKAVQEVVVTAGTASVQTRLDRQVYSVERNLQATSGTAADILGEIPSVTVDPDGNVTLRGDANVTILVDGKPSAQFDAATRGLSLQQFPASEIDHIEVLTAPPAQYKAEGSAGVINIVTKKRRAPGPSGAVQFLIGDRRRYVFAADGAENVGPLRLSGGIGLRQDAKQRITDDDRLTIDPVLGPVASTQAVNEQFLRLIPSVKGSVAYDLSPKQTVSANFSHRELTGNRYFDQLDQSGPSGAPLESISLRHSDGHEWAVDASEGLSFDQQLGLAGESLSLSVQRSVTGERERYFYTNTFTLPPGPPTYDDLHLGLDLVKTDVSADYVRPLGKDGSFKAGYDFEDDHNDYDNFGHTLDPAPGVPGVIDPNVTNHFIYRQQVNAAYGQLETPYGSWTIQAGVRIEGAHVSTYQITGGVSGGRNDFGVYPSLHLERMLGDTARLSISVARRITRPDPEALNPFVDHQNTQSLRAGNPDLLPQDTLDYEVGYNDRWGGLTYGATGYYRFDRNSVTDIVEPVSADVVLATKTNLPQSHSAGLEFQAGGKIGQPLSYSVSGNLFYTQIDATGLGQAGLASTTGINLKASLDWRPTAADTAQVSFSRTDKRLTPQGWISAVNLVNVGYKHQLTPGLALVATVTDLFDGQRQERVIVTPVLSDNYLRHQLGRVALVGFTYTFGASKKGKGSGFQYDQ